MSDTCLCGNPIKEEQLTCGHPQCVKEAKKILRGERENTASAKKALETAVTELQKINKLMV